MIYKKSRYVLTYDENIGSEGKEQTSRSPIDLWEIN